MSDKDKALEAGLAAIKKQYGNEAVFLGSDKSLSENIERIPTGSIALDLAMSGGYAKGRIVELYGPESSGKTTLTLHAIIECQKQGGKCAFIDMEHALDVGYASAIGVNINELIFAQPDTAEQALNIIQQLTRTGALDLIILDSVAALVPQKEIEGEIGDSHVGITARLMGQACRALAGVAANTGTTIIFINQIRMKIGVMFGNPETRPGGRALGFFASQILDIRKSATNSEGEEKTSITSTVKVVKSKVGIPLKTASFDIRFGQGIDWATDLLTVAVEKEIIDKSGAWYSYKGQKIGQGSNNASQWLKEHPEDCNTIQQSILDHHP